MDSGRFVCRRTLTRHLHYGECFEESDIISLVERRTVIRIGDKLGPANTRVGECGGAGWRYIYQPAAPRVSLSGAGAHRASHADGDDEFMRACVSLGCLTLIKCYTPGSGATAEKDRQVDSSRHYRVHAYQGRLAQYAELD
uniref:Uncharacterized protein n=1 Tax=Hyaloperonospora arabidopsidis (strain Emoy2) TaxID=559515 RepID=M4B5H0_HYAAE